MPHLKASSIRTCDTCRNYAPNMQCKLFGRVSLLSGAVYKATVFEARLGEHCGQEGKYWEPSLAFEKLSDSSTE